MSSSNPSNPGIPGWKAFLGLLILIVITGSLLYQAMATSDSGLPVLGVVPPFAMVTHSHQLFTDSSFLGKISVVDFFFTRCSGPCPQMAMEMSYLHQLFASYPQVQFVSITVDPSYDTLPVLREYADPLKADERWHFLWGSEDKVVSLSEDGFRLGAGVLPAQHSTKFVVVDWKGQIRGYYDSQDSKSMATLAKDLRRLVRGKARKHQ